MVNLRNSLGISRVYAIYDCEICVIPPDLPGLLLQATFHVTQSLHAESLRADTTTKMACLAIIDLSGPMSVVSSEDGCSQPNWISSMKLENYPCQIAFQTENSPP